MKTQTATTTDATEGVPPMATAGPNGEERIRQVPLEEITQSRFNRKIDPKTLDPEFVDSIGARGIIQPLIVRPDPRKLNIYELIAGERRLTAARLKKLATAPVIVRQMTDTEAIELQAIENLQRLDLSPIEEAEKYQQLLDQYRKIASLSATPISVEKAVAQVGQRVGKGSATIFQALRLLKLPEPVKAAVSSGKLPPSHAAELAKLEEAPEVQSRLLKIITAPIPDKEDDDDQEFDWSRDGAGVLSFRDTKAEIDNEVKLTKARKDWEKTAKEFTAKGGKVVNREEIQKAPREKYVAGADWLYGYGRSGTYKALMGKHAPAAILSCSLDYRPEYYFLKTAAITAVEKNGHKKQTGHSVARSGAQSDYEKRKRRQREKAARMKPVIEAARRAIVTAAKKPSARLPWGHLVQPILYLIEGERLKDILRAYGWKPKSGWIGGVETCCEEIDKMPLSKIPGLLAEIMTFPRQGVWNLSGAHFHPHFVTVAKHYGVDLAKLTKELAPEPKKEPKKAKVPTIDIGTGLLSKKQQAKLAKTIKKEAEKGSLQTPGLKKPLTLNDAGRKKLSAMMKARWAAVRARRQKAVVGGQKGKAAK